MNRFPAVPEPEEVKLPTPPPPPDEHLPEDPIEEEEEQVEITPIRSTNEMFVQLKEPPYQDLPAPQVAPPPKASRAKAKPKRQISEKQAAHLERIRKKSVEARLQKKAAQSTPAPTPAPTPALQPPTPAVAPTPQVIYMPQQQDSLKREDIESIVRSTMQSTLREYGNEARQMRQLELEKRQRERDEAQRQVDEHRLAQTLIRPARRNKY